MAAANLLLLVVDDLRPDLGCYGETTARTPNLDNLAASGTVFRRAYCQTPVCGPSRACLLTGIRPLGERFKAWDCKVAVDSPGATTLPGHLKQHGYTCLSVGKVFHHGSEAAQDWSAPPLHPPLPDGRTWTHLDYQMPANRALMAERAQTTGRALGPAWECADADDDAYVDGGVAREACAALDRLSAAGSPFLLAAGFIRPHLPFLAPKRYWDLHPEESVGDPRDFFVPENAPAKAIHACGELRAYHGMPKEGPLSPAQARTMIRAYRASTSFVDACLGRVLDRLKALGRDQDTVVVLLGDHGWFLGEHTLWCKHSTFHLGIHAPLVIRAPGMAPARCDRLAEFVDVIPTLCDLTGIPIPAQCEGDSLVPLLRDPTRAWKPAAFSRFYDARCVISEAGVYTRWDTPDGGEAARMFYDHRDDPRESRNVADDPARRAEVERHRALLAAGWQAARPPMR